MTGGPLRFLVWTFFLLLIIQAELSSSRNDQSDGRQFFNFFRPQTNNNVGPTSVDRNTRSCTTPGQLKGLCMDVIDCPSLFLDLQNLLRSICFKKNFRPGTCCPIESPTTTTTTTTPSTTTKRVTKATTTTKKHSEDKITTLKPTTTASTTESSTTVATTKKPSLLPWMTPPGYTSDPPSTTTRKPRPGSRIECGVPKATQARIVNGTESYPGKWPWMAALYLQSFLSNEFHCGGTIISKRFILTAAHCMIDKRSNEFSPKQFLVRLGDHDLSSFDTPLDRHAKDYKVKSITIHEDFENFSHQYFKNDIALLELTTDIDFSPFAIPVCLPSKALSLMPTDALSGTMATVKGYGRTSYNGQQSKRILEATMPIWWNKACDDAYFPPILETNVCAGFVEGGIDSCQGDSGGPLVIKRNGRWIQLGIVSFGQRCAEPGYPGVYTRVPKFLTWIRNKIRKS